MSIHNIVLSAQNIILSVQNIVLSVVNEILCAVNVPAAQDFFNHALSNFMQ